MHTWPVSDSGTGQCDHGANHEDSGKELILVRSVTLKRTRKSSLGCQVFKKDTILFEFSASFAVHSCKRLMIKNYCLGFLNIV